MTDEQLAEHRGYTIELVGDGKYAIIRSTSDPSVVRRVRVGPSNIEPVYAPA